MVTELLATQNSDTITFPGAVPLSIWVEWDTPGIGTAEATLDFRLLDDVSGNTVFTDRLVFHPFTSIVIALGGEGQTPSDPAADSHGTFQTAIELYREGYDVHMYDEDNVNQDGSGAVYNEIVEAIQTRGVTDIAIFGYSHGGGSVQELSVLLHEDRPVIGTFRIAYTAYIDAVDGSNSPNPSQENERPAGTLYHLNIYQENGPFELGGGPLVDPEPQDDEIDVTTTPWGVDLGHGDIDDNMTVRNLVKDRLRARIDP